MTPTTIMQSLIFVIASVFAMQGCTTAALSDAGLSDVLPIDPCGGACTGGTYCAVAPGCDGAPTYQCAPNTCADASVVFFCGCDGRTFSNPEGACTPRTQRYRFEGICVDAGVSVDANSGG